jgi:uncharacterized protein YlxW (UPF0749 family)
MSRHRSQVAPGVRARRRLREALLRPHPSRGQLVAGLLCGLLGFAAVVQVRSAQEAGLGSLRETELIGILDDVSERSERLRAEARELEATRARLTTGSDRERAALEEARRRAEVLGVLAGTVPATGPGIEVVIPDPRGEVRAEVLLDAVQELRDAGGEAFQINDVRVVASTWFAERDGAVVVDGEPLTPPYRLLVVGDPPTLASSLDIPGGVRERLAQDYGVTARVEQLDRVDVTALRRLEDPEYARPAPEATGGAAR